MDLYIDEKSLTGSIFMLVTFLRGLPSCTVTGYNRYSLTLKTTVVDEKSLNMAHFHGLMGSFAAFF